MDSLIVQCRVKSFHAKKMTEHIIVDVNGVENVDLSNIKCPICGSKMDVHRIEPKDYDRDGRLQREYHSYVGHVNVYYEPSRQEIDFVFQCPHCKAELAVTQTVVRQLRQPL